MADTKTQLVDWLDDLCVRFIINLPREELSSVERICFQIEEAQWFYEDFVRPLDPNLPSLTLRQFCLKIFQHCPLFSGYDAALHSNAFSEFLAYKTRVPVRGAILLNDAMTEAVLVKGWKKGANWSFPRGKINKDEKDIDCAVREVYEETGYDVRAAGLLKNEDETKFVEVTMREQHVKLFIFAGVPINTYFEPRTRKEISSIQWYKLSDLPTSKKLKQQQQHETAGGEKLANKFYMVAPFLGPLKKIIAQLRKANNSSKNANIAGVMAQQQLHEHPAHQMNGHDSESKDTIGGLVAMLRESKQTTERQRYPDRLTSVLSEDDISARLRDMLNVSGPGPDIATSTPARENAAAVRKNSAVARENKAQAMMSLIRSGSSQSSANNARKPTTQRSESVQKQPPAPAAPLATQLWPLTNLPPSPLAAPAGQDVPGGRPLSNRTAATHPALDPAVGVPGPHHAEAGPSVGYKPFLPTAPYHITGESSSLHGINSSQADIGTSAPAAGKLPLPKLNAHSSALLNLFKSSPSPGLPNPSIRPETVTGPLKATGSKAAADGPHAAVLPKAAAGPRTATGHSATLLGLFKNTGARPTTPAKQSPETPPAPSHLETSRTVEAADGHASKTPQSARTTHQEALLGLFKTGTGLSGKSTSFPATSPPAVELSAVLGNSEAPRIEGRPAENAADGAVGISEPSQIKVAKRPNMATNAQSPKRRSQQSKGTRQDTSKSIKILPRPQPQHAGSSDYQLPAAPVPRSQRAGLTQDNSLARKDLEQAPTPKPFQPQILKRPASSDAAPLDLLDSASIRSFKPGADGPRTAHDVSSTKSIKPATSGPQISILPRPSNTTDQTPPNPFTMMEGSIARKEWGLISQERALEGDPKPTQPLMHDTRGTKKPSMDDEFLMKYLGQVAQEGR